MLLEKQIQQDMVSAMKNQEKDKLAVLRMLITAIKNEKVRKGNIHDEMADEKVIAVLQNQVKQRKDSYQQYLEAQRADLAEKELAEIEIIKIYLPEMMSMEQILVTVKEIAQNIGAKTQADFGKLMGAVMAKLKGKAEGEMVKQAVENYFNNFDNPPKEEKKEEINWQEKYLRLGAEFDNFRKRVEQEKFDFVKYSNLKIFLELIPILTNFEKAFVDLEESQKQNPVIKGMALIKKELEKIFEVNKVKKIEAVGQKFDPNFHEVLMQADWPKDEILQEVETGYLLDKKVIKVAKVIVGKG